MQPELGRFSGTMEHWAEPFDSANGHVHSPKIKRLTAFPALLPAASLLPKPTRWTRPIQPEADTGVFAPRLTAFPALLSAASTLTQPTKHTQPAYPEAETGFIQQGQRPVDLSYVLPAASTVVKTEQRQEASSRFAPPIGFPAVPTPSQVPGIDVNRLTEQVYQALERKIRLEKQRRGYR
jgi:hypothetical protein